MKKIIFTLAMAISFSSLVQAQAFKKGDVMLSPGFGLGLYGVGYGVGFAVPVVFNADIGVHDYVSVGAYGAFWTKKWNYGFNDNYRFTSSHFGVRGSFHWWQLLDEKVNADLKGDKLDIYLTVWMGYNLRTAKWIDSGSGTNLGFGNRFQGGAQLGMRYFFHKNIGVFAEWGGTPSAYSNIGLSFKF
jgi:hypothetical protein